MADNRLEVQIGAQIGELTSELSSAKSAISEAADSMKGSFKDLQASTEDSSKGVAESLNALTEQALSLREVAFKVIEALSGLEGIKFATELVTGGAEIAENLTLISERTGIATEELSRLKFAAESSGIGIDTVAMAIQRLDLRMQMLAQTGNDSAGKALADLKINQVAFMAADATDKFEMLGAAIEKFGANSRVIGDLGEIIGRSGAQLIPFLEHMQELETESDRLGATLKGSTIEAADKFEESLKALGSQWDAFKVSLAAALSGPLAALVSVLEEITKRLIVWAQDGSLKKWGEESSIAAINFAEAAIQALGPVKQFLDDIVSAAERVKSTFSEFGDAFTNIGGLGVGTGTSLSEELPKGGADTGGAVASATSALMKFLEGVKANIGKAPSSTATTGTASMGAPGPSTADIAAAKKAAEEAKKATALAYADFVEEQKLEIAEANNTADSKIQAYQKVYQEAVTLYGQQSKQARTAAVEEAEAIDAGIKQRQASIVQETNDIVREQASQLAVVRATLQQELAEHTITKSQEKALEDQLDEQIIAAKLNAAQQEQSIYAQGTKQYEEYTAQIIELTNEMRAKQIAVQTQIVNDNEEAATRATEAWRSAFSSINGAFDQLISGATSSTQKISQLFRSMALDLGKSLAETGLKDLLMGTSAAPGANQTKGFFNSGGLAGLFGGAGSSNTPQAQAQATAQALNPLFSTQTNAIVAAIHQGPSGGAGGGGSGGGAMAANMASSTTAQNTKKIGDTLNTSLGFLGEIGGHTAKMATGIAQMVVSIAEQAALLVMMIFTEATSVHPFGFSGGGLVPSAAGGMVLGGGDMPTLSLLHPKEMVLPAHLSEGVQNLINRGGAEAGGGDHHTHVHYHGNISAIDARGMKQVLSDHAEHLSTLVQRQMINKGQAFRQR